MQKISIIRRVLAIAGVLLLVFSITPKKTLHNFFGCHQEQTKPDVTTHGTQLVTSIFHCSCDQVDFQTAFTPSFFLFEPKLNVQHATAFTQLSSMPLETDVTSAHLRGPPATL